MINIERTKKNTTQPTNSDEECCACRTRFIRWICGQIRSIPHWDTSNIKSRAAAQQQQKTRKKTISIFSDCERRGNQSTRAISYCWWPLILISSVCSGSCTSSPRTIVRCHHQISLVDVHILGTSHENRIKCLWPIFNRKKSILSPRVCALCMAVKKRSNWCQPVYFFFFLVSKLRIYSNSRSFSTSSHFAFSFFLSASLFIHTQLPDLSCIDLVL